MKQNPNFDKIESDYHSDGVVRIKDFFTANKVAEIRNELNRYIKNELPSRPLDASTMEADGKTIRNLWRLEVHSAYFKKLALQPEIINLIAKLVGDDPILVGVETFNKPAFIGSGVPYHQDNAYFCQTPPNMLTLWVAIDKVTVENGAVYFIKGSHKLGMLQTKPSGVSGNSIGLSEPIKIHKSDQFCATLNSGDATIHHCEIIHHSEPNRTVNSRLGLLFVYRDANTEYDLKLKENYTEALAVITNNTSINK